MVAKPGPRSQLAAAISTFVSCTIAVMAGLLAEQVQAGTAAELLQFTSLLVMMQELAQGVVDPRWVPLHLGVTALLLAATVVALNPRRRREHAAQLLFLHPEAGGDAGQVPHRPVSSPAQRVGIGGGRGLDGAGLDTDFILQGGPDYPAKANAETFLVVQIEEPEVVPYIDEIAATPGVDVLFVGPADLTLGLGKFGKTDDPEVRAILQSVADACARHGKVAAIPCAPEQVKGYHDMGFRFFNVISDFRCVSTGMRSNCARR